MTVAATGQSVSEPLALVVTSGSHVSARIQNWSPVSNHGLYVFDNSTTKELGFVEY